MPKVSTSSFVTEIPLHTSSKEQSVLGKRFFAAKQQYNALLGEGLRRLETMRMDARFQQAKAYYKQPSKKLEARELFKVLAKDHGYREYDLYGYCKQWNKKNSSLSIGARISQKLAKRAFSAVEEYRKGIRGKPRYKGYRGLASIEDNSIDANLRLVDDTLYYLGLQLPVRYDLQDPVHCYGLQAPIKYVRIVRRNFNTRTRYFAQLICEGSPLIKPQHQGQQGTVGLDIGPQTIAIVSPDNKYAHLQVFADELQEIKGQRAKLQRRLSRKLRLNNPDAFGADRWEKKDKHWQHKQGKSLKGKRITRRTKALKRTAAQLADIARRQAAHRKSQHGKLANKILGIGTTIKTEKLSYKAFQKLYGRSVGLRAPGMLVERLKRKAENALSRQVEEINTWCTKLSQTCHCGKQEKKPLKQRWHNCPCGVKAQRDLYSAYLAAFVVKDKLMVDQAQKAWSGMDIALRTTMKRIEQTSSGSMPASLGLRSGSKSVVCDVP